MTNPTTPGFYTVTLGGRYPSEADSQSLHFLYWNRSTFVYATGEEVDERTVRGWEAKDLWISVDDRLPECGESVRVFCPGGEPEELLAYRRGQIWETRLLGSDPGNIICNVYVTVEGVTKWQPLPKSPAQ